MQIDIDSVTKNIQINDLMTATDLRH